MYDDESKQLADALNDAPETKNGNGTAEEVLPLKLKFPDSNSRGFLKRQRAANQLQLRQLRLMRDLKRAQARAKANAESENGVDESVDVTGTMLALLEETDTIIEEMTAFALTFVVEPQDRAEARAALEDLPQADWNAIFEKARGGNAVPNENSAS